jgi:hypothetical protein
MIFLVSIHESLLVMSLSPRSDALSLIITRGVDDGAGIMGLGMEESKDESSRMEMTELMSGCARGTKTTSGDLVVDIDLTLRVGQTCAAPPKDRESAMDAPPSINPLPLWVSGDIPSWLPRLPWLPPMNTVGTVLS